MAPSRTGLPKGYAATELILEKRVAISVAFALGMCSASFFGISFVQIAPAAAVGQHHLTKLKLNGPEGEELRRK